jgi:hypothetical protein
MEFATYQTIRLSAGRHRSPEDGACAVELASMLAGEPFSDQPASVCPVIASLLRAYNDSVDDERRQHLYSYASKIVGSRRSERIQRARAERLKAWTLDLQERRWTRLIPRRLRRLAWMPELDVIGPQAVRAMDLRDARSHAEALAMIDELLLVGRHQSDGATDPRSLRAAPSAAPTG